MIYLRYPNGKEYFYATTFLGRLRIKYLDLPIHQTGIQMVVYQEIAQARDAKLRAESDDAVSLINSIFRGDQPTP